METREDQFKDAKALLFDYIGTTTDWLTPVLGALEQNAPDGADVDWKDFAYKWRADFFAFVAELAGRNEPQMPMNDVYFKTLARISEGKNLQWSEQQKLALIRSWSELPAWSDTAKGIARLRKRFIVYATHPTISNVYSPAGCAMTSPSTTLSNGSTRVIIDSARRNKTDYDMFFTSDIVGAYKPQPHTYQTAMKLLQLKPSECIMVAAHAYDLEAAAKQGMKTIYITRETEDVDVDLSRYSFDLTIHKGGLLGLADALGV